MGYVPPVRDEQLVLYGNRINRSYRGIKPTSPVQKGNFLEVLADKEKQAFNRNTQLVGKKRNRKKHQVVQEITGKGHYIDEVV